MMQHSNHSSALGLLSLVVLAALFVHGEDTTPSSAGTLNVPRAANNATSQAEELVASSTLACSQATNCSQCKSNSCGWCGDSDAKGFCYACTNSDCKADACPYRYQTHNLCPSEIDDVLLGLGAIIGIVVGGVVGGCCLLCLLGGLIYCLCFRHRGYHHL